MEQPPPLYSPSAPVRPAMSPLPFFIGGVLVILAAVLAFYPGYDVILRIFGISVEMTWNAEHAAIVARDSTGNFTWYQGDRNGSFSARTALPAGVDIREIVQGGGRTFLLTESAQGTAITEYVENAYVTRVAVPGLSDIDISSDGSFIAGTKLLETDTSAVAIDTMTFGVSTLGKGFAAHTVFVGGVRGVVYLHGKQLWLSTYGVSGWSAPEALYTSEVPFVSERLATDRESRIAFDDPKSHGVVEWQVTSLIPLATTELHTYPSLAHADLLYEGGVLYGVQFIPDPEWNGAPHIVLTNVADASNVLPLSAPHTVANPLFFVALAP